MAVFTEEEGTYNVHFPDLPGCYTCGENISDAVNMAQDALCLWLYDLEQDKSLIPSATMPNDIGVGNGEFTSVIAVDTDAYRRFYENKSVKKTLTIPMWLNERAEHANVNFSQVLQASLKEHLGIAQ